MKRFVALFCFMAILITFVACGKKNTPVAADSENVGIADGEIVKLLLSPYGDEETVGLNAPARNYVSVTVNGYFNPTDLKFVSDDPDIAEIKYDSTALENCIYYRIEGVSTGKTRVHIESADGKVRSQDIFVTVKEYISTTTQLSIEYKPYHTQEEVRRYYYDNTTKKTTEKTTTKTTNTTGKSEKSTKATRKTSATFTITLPTNITRPTTPSTSSPPTEPPSRATAPVTQKTTKSSGQTHRAY